MGVLRTSKIKNQENKLELLNDIPCGNKFPDCKFICDANKAKNSKNKSRPLRGAKNL